MEGRSLILVQLIHSPSCLSFFAVCSPSTGQRIRWQWNEVHEKLLLQHGQRGRERQKTMAQRRTVVLLLCCGDGGSRRRAERLQATPIRIDCSKREMQRPLLPSLCIVIPSGTHLPLGHFFAHFIRSLDQETTSNRSRVSRSFDRYLICHICMPGKGVRE